MKEKELLWKEINSAIVKIILEVSQQNKNRIIIWLMYFTLYHIPQEHQIQDIFVPQVHSCIISYKT